MNSLIVLLFLLTSTAYSQCMDSLWISSPGTQNSDQGTGVALANDGMVVACGYVDVTGITQGFGWLSKVNPATGEATWSHQYSGGSQSILTDIARTNDGGFICGGWARNPANNDQNYWLLRVNPDGDSIWSRTYGHEFANQATSVNVAPDGGFVIAGRSHSLPGGAGGHDWWVLKTNSNGDSLWSARVGSFDEDTAYDMIVTAGNNYLVGGRSVLDSTGAARMALFGPTGTLLWDHLYEFDANVEIHGLFQGSSGLGYVACGAQHGLNQNNDVMLMETDDSGNLLWHRKFEFDIPGAAVANTILPDGHDGYYLIGHAQRVSTTDNDVFVLHVSSCGDSVGIKWVGNAVSEEAARAVITSFDEIITSGVAVLPGNQREILLYGLSNDFCNMPPCSFTRITPRDSTMPDLDFPFVMNWRASHDPEGAPIQYTFHIESTYPEDFFISPHDTVTTDTFYHLELMVPLSPLDEVFEFRWRVWATDGINTVEASNGEGFFQLDIIMDADDNLLTPNDFTLSAYPNPFNPTTTLNFTLSQSSHVQLDLFDIQGRLVTSLANEIMTAGSHNVSVDGSGLASGIYFAKLQAGAQARTAKLVMMK
ncbi:T9SS type A sorting domain-containing protein [bacterium]|nr:T9SS type A sorting domain-containing protein [bacterium]